MKLLLPILLGLTTLTTALPQETARPPKGTGNPCGFKIAPCPQGTFCKPNDPACPPLRGENCLGVCTASPPVPAYISCGGFRIQTTCPKGMICIDDPRREGCGMACDAPGICVTPEFCGGIAAFKCKDERKMCIDDPRDDCDVENGGADCGGICV